MSRQQFYVTFYVMYGMFHRGLNFASGFICTLKPKNTFKNL